MSTEPTSFDPAKHLMNLNGRGEYLEVKWRLVWLRTEHPDAMIETELVRENDRSAIFKCRISIPGGGTATGWGSEDASDFRDYLEKAETKAIGRALAALGYGTQFCQDHEFGGTEQGQMRVVDAPVNIQQRHQQPARASDQNDQQATERQRKYIRAIALETGLDDEELGTWCQELYTCTLEQLNRRDASTLIEALQRRRNEVG